MAVDVEELLITPFEEVVEKGRDAAANAEATQGDDPELSKQMSKMAQAVVREGERALKRLQPLWDSHVEKYGEAFKESIRANDEIAGKRRTLENLLYDFEDFVEVDSFEADKFIELQAATKSLALDALDIIKRLKIDPSLAQAPASPPVVHSFPPLPPLPQVPNAQRTSSRSSKGAPRPDTRAGAESPVGNLEPKHGFSLFPQPPLTNKQQASLNGFDSRVAPVTSGSRSNRQSGLYRAGTASSRTSSIQVDDGRSDGSRRFDSRTRVASIKHPSVEPAQPDPARPDNCSVPSQTFFTERRSSSPDGLVDDLDFVRIVDDPLHPPSPAPRRPLLRATGWSSEGSEAPQQDRTQQQIDRHQTADHSIGTSSGRSVVANSPHLNRRPTNDATGKSPHQKSTSYTSTSPSNSHPTSPATTQRTSLFSESNKSSSNSPSAAHTAPIHETRTSSLAALNFKETVAVANLPLVGEDDDGLMLAEEATLTKTSSTQLRSVTTAKADASCLIGPKSSFHQAKGFCEGATTVRQTYHTQGWRRAPAYGESTVVGRCTGCEYYQIHHEMKLDLEGDSRANFMKSGVIYRLRFLFKSHMTVRNISETHFACLFCIQTGHTVQESDATVFQTADALLRHLSRHSQPLPEVPGVTVLYGKAENLNGLEEDYDLHFPSPPVSSPVPDTAVGMLPTATAVKSHIRRQGEKALVDPDGSEEVLSFIAGARIIGVEFPVKWGGKWCLGWHDGVRSSFPLKMVEVTAPKQKEVSLLGNSSISATVKWKWSPKDPSKGGWLPLSKGETISNIGWIYHDHWCWSGTNSKGKLGVFPSSHMEPAAINEEPGAKKSSKGGLFSRRRRSIGTESSFS